MGMMGGGSNALIRAIHRNPVNMDGLIGLECEALNFSPEAAKESGRPLFLPEERIYSSYQEISEKESQLPEDQRMDFVSIVTPNSVHFEPAIMALEKGFHVVIEKPMTFTRNEAK